MASVTKKELSVLMDSPHLAAVKDMLKENKQVSVIVETLGSLGFKGLEGETLENVIQLYDTRRQTKEIYLADVGSETLRVDSTDTNIRALLMRGAGTSAKGLLSDSPLEILEAAKSLKAIFDAWQSLNKADVDYHEDYAKICIEMND